MKPFIAEQLAGKKVLKHGRILPPPMDKDEATECLLKVREIFQKYNITFWLVGGTLLGAVRDGDFIPWDTDIDLAFYATDDPKLMPAIRDMQDFGLKVIRTCNIDNWFQAKKNLICIGFASNWPYRQAMWRWYRFYEPFDVYSELIEWPFLGKKFLIPKRYECYLETHYGDWRTPNPKCKHARLFRIPPKDLRQR
jgi:hypothetical protein